MRPTAYLIPARDDVTVLDPANGKALPPEGAEMILNNYWRRRIADGDVTIGLKPEPKKTAKGAK